MFDACERLVNRRHDGDTTANGEPQLLPELVDGAHRVHNSGMDLTYSDADEAFRKEIPEYFSDLILRLLEHDASRRPASALAILRYLKLHSELPGPQLETEGLDSVLQKLPLVGREMEARRFLEYFKDERSRSGPGWIELSGATGLGRSRFLDEMK